MSLTDLARNHPVNMVVLGLDGRPRQKGLLEILSEWIHFRIDTVTRRTRARLEKIRVRVHLLEGRLLAFANLDEIIEILRHSDDPKQALIDRFGITEVQADDILAIRLRQLAKLVLLCHIS